MARETVAQRNARFDAERDARLAKEVAEYPARLMTALTRASNAYFEITVYENQFKVRGRDTYEPQFHTLEYSHTPDSEYELEELEYYLNRHEREVAEQKRLAEVKAEALRKINEHLSKEEREALGL